MIRNIILIVIFFFIPISMISCKKKTKKKDLFKNMALVPGGEFIMGTNEIDKEKKAEAYGIPKPWFEDETPERKIFIKTFYIDKYEVTNRQYKKFIDSVNYTPPGDWENNVYSQGTANHPVTYVDFRDAFAYSQWAGKILPTESQWEKAARGTDGRLYPWGNKFDVSKANLSKSMTEMSVIMPVGSKKDGASPYGVYDMIGNVWEWTSAWYEPYKGNNKQKKEYGKKFLVLRGISYFYLGHFPDDIYTDLLSHMARPSYREEVYPTLKSPDVGFRCIKYEN